MKKQVSQRIALEEPIPNSGKEFTDKKFRKKKHTKVSVEAHGSKKRWSEWLVL